MRSQAAHPEVVALALIILALGVGAGPERALAPLDEWDRRIADIETRLNEKAAEIESRIAGRLAELGERLDSRWGSRLESPKLRRSHPPPAAGVAVSL
jgi:hypothetical protein